MMVVCILLAALIYLLIGYIGEDEIAGVVVALIPLAIGLLWPDVLVDIVTGNFHFKFPWFW